MELDGNQFNEAEFNRQIIQILREIPSGRQNATNYHRLISGICTYLFYPHLITPTLELEINQGRKRIDIAFANASPLGFFADQRSDPFLQAREIMIECKNYTEDLANNEIDQMIGRFDPRRGRLGIIACRSVEDQDRLVERCRDAFRAQQGAILVFTDDDFEALLNAHDIAREPAIQNMCRAKFRALMQ